MWGRRRRAWGLAAAVAMACGALVAVPIGAGSPGAVAAPAAASPSVLRVGTWLGVAGQYRSIQAAVDAAKPGDWVLVAPGDYHERADDAGAPRKGGAAVHIATVGLHLRGMDRNRVVVDGTKPGSPTCDPTPASQDLGRLLPGGATAGRNGVVVDKADDVTVENLTVCNFLSGQGGGNQIWFNGGDGSGQVGLGSYRGAYLTATTTYFAGTDKPNGSYGIFVSNAKGPGLIDQTYASNMTDSSYYIGACPDCNAVLTHAHAQHSALGYSGTNAGGHLQITSSEWDDNRVGIVTNSQNNDDAPPPQDGSCPGGGVGLLGTHSCEFIAGNYVHDNNNPNVPSSIGIGPIGSGIVISGGRHDTVIGNRVEHQDAWGILTVPFPDDHSPPPVAHCQGGTPGFLVKCYFDDWANEVTSNVLAHNGGFGNVTNGDLGDLSNLHTPGNCWHGNTDPAGIRQSPVNLQQTHADCGAPNAGADLGSPLANQLLCATEAFGPCPDTPGHHYPKATKVTVRPLVDQVTMPNPCVYAPRNPWCPNNPLPTTTTAVPPTTGSPTSAPGSSPPASPAPAAPAAPVEATSRFTG